MRYVSLFAGIEAASQGWHHMGWEPVAFADIDQFPSAVLAHHYPEVPNVGNVEEVDWNEYRGKADLVVGGSPCQSFSVAGRRLGLDDPRGNLALEFLRAVKEIQPTWFLFENVPGLLSSDEGRDFGIFLGEVAEIGYGFAYRILDSQFFGVPQRRRRVFVVGHIGGDWRSAAAVLFERESLQGHSKESEAQGKTITDYIGTSTSSQSEPGRRVVEPIAFEQNQRSEVRETEVAGPIKAGKGSNNQTFIAQNWDGEDKTGTLTTRSMQQFMPDKDNFMAVVEPQVFDARGGGDGETTNTLASGRNAAGVGDFTPLAVESKIFDATNPNGKTDVSPTLNARDNGSTGDPIVYEYHGQDSRVREVDVASTLNTNGGDGREGHLVGEETQVYENHPSDGRITEVDTSPTITAKAGTGGGNLPLVKEGEVIGFDWKNAAQTNFDEKNSGAPVTAEGGLAVKQTSMAVRRLTPLECERLQGFPDEYTRIPWRKKAPEDCPDGPRYKALGNSMAVPVMRWIGEGIQIVDDLVSNMTEREEAVTIVQKSIFDF